MSSSEKRVSREYLKQKEWYPMPWDGVKRTVHTETIEQTHATLEKYSRLKREAKHKKYEEYKIFYYGTPLEKAHYQRNLRDYLQEQIEQKGKQTVHFSANTEESQQLAKDNAIFNKHEKELSTLKRQQLMTIRDSNKLSMDIKTEQLKKNKRNSQSFEMKLLEYNPINWSQTLS